MAKTASKNQILFARLVVVLMIAFAVFGAVWYGFSEEVRHRVWQQLIDRPTGPMAFRFILQPVMAADCRDALRHRRRKVGTFSLFWTLLSNPLERFGRLNEGLISTARIIFLGLSMDLVYQLIVLKTFYPGEAVIVAIALALVPYALLRGPIARIARWRLAPGLQDESR